MLFGAKLTDQQKAQILEIMDAESKREKFELLPACTEDEYAIISQMWRVFKANAGSEGKKMCVALLRDYIAKDNH